MNKQAEIDRARADVQKLKQEYETARQLWKSRPSAKKQDNKHRLWREYEKAQAALQQLERELSRTTAKRLEQESARTNVRQREPEREGARVLDPPEQVRRPPNRGLER